MADQKIKFKVSIKELTFEYEGIREVGQALQSGLTRSLGALLETQRVAMATPPATPAPLPMGGGTLFDGMESDDTAQNGHTDNTPANGKPAAPEKPKRTRKSGGETAMTLLRGLIAEGFFKDARTVENIRERLRVKGHNNPSGLTTRLQELTKKDELFRDPSENGFVYKDTPFNAAPGTPTAPVEPAE